MLWTAPIVICGFGEVGSAVARAALGNGRHPHQVTVVERDGPRARQAGACGHRVVFSDATCEQTLRSAGAGVAANIIICLGDDCAPVAVQAARSLAPQAAIQVVLASPSNECAAIDAGADLVLPLSRIAGKLLADAALRTVGGHHHLEVG